MKVPMRSQFVASLCTLPERQQKQILFLVWTRVRERPSTPLRSTTFSRLRFQVQILHPHQVQSLHRHQAQSPRRIQLRSLRLHLVRSPLQSHRQLQTRSLRQNQAQSQAQDLRQLQQDHNSSLMKFVKSMWSWIVKLNMDLTVVLLVFYLRANEDVRLEQQ